MVEKYLDSWNVILTTDLHLIRVMAIFALVFILFLSSYYNIVSAETIMCKNIKKSCKGTERTDVLVGNKNPTK
jgi:hypothetical protein